MSTHMNTDIRWLKRMVEKDDGGPVSAGGLAARLGLLAPSRTAEGLIKSAFARFVELSRRKRGWTVEHLAVEADIELVELMAIERGEAVTPEARTVRQLAKVLELRPEPLMELAGLAVGGSDRISKAAVRFAAKAEPVDRLSREEDEALTWFVDQLSKV